MIAKIALPTGAVLLFLYITVSILTSQSNALSEAMIYAAGFGLLLGLLNSHAGLVFVFICGNYLDFFKRFLVVSGSFNFGDVIKTLAVAPVAMMGVYAGVLVNSGKLSGTHLSKSRLFLASATCLVILGSNLLSGGGSLSSNLQTAANSALYVGLLACAGPLYPTLASQHKFLRKLVILFVPVVIYGWIQLIFGYNKIEVNYALSGLTVNLQPLLNPAEVEYKRIFSLMGSTVSYTLVGTTLSLYALIFGFDRAPAMRFLGIIFAVCCLGSHVPGAGRTGWAVAMITFCAYYVFKRKNATLVLYAFSVTTILIFLFNSRLLGRKLVDLTASWGNSEFQRRATTMGSFTTRTEGVANVFTNSRYFSLFGLPKNTIRESGAHDLLGQIYTTTGAVGLMLAVIVGASTLYYLHSNILRIVDIQRRNLAAFLMASTFAVLVAGIFSGSQLHVFPVNVYFWLSIGFIFQLISINQTEINHSTVQSGVQQSRARRKLEAALHA